MLRKQQNWSTKNTARDGKWSDSIRTNTRTCRVKRVSGPSTTKSPGFAPGLFSFSGNIISFRTCCDFRIWNPCFYSRPGTNSWSGGWHLFFPPFLPAPFLPFSPVDGTFSFLWCIRSLCASKLCISGSAFKDPKMRFPGWMALLRFLLRFCPGEFASGSFRDLLRFLMFCSCPETAVC